MINYPQPPRSSEALGAAWIDVQSRLPPGWWIHLYAEYGEEAYWVARLAASQAAAVTNWPEAVAPTPEGALTGVLEQLTDATLEDAAPVGVTPPTGAGDAASFAAAWKLAATSLPPGWWISGLDGYDDDPSHPSGWLAFAFGGPDSDYDGEQGIGSTPEQALATLSEELRSRRSRTGA